MSRINRIRIINLNYNNNAIRIDDECFDLVNANTLLSLRNGGGKSVLIQMITAPFVHKRYRDTADRPFASYFNTNQPTFILVEWSLGHEAGYVLTGMMVRKNQETKEDDVQQPELEMLNFIHEYTHENEFDIVNFPLIQTDNHKKVLQGFNTCKKMFESCKLNKQYKFDYYDMNQSTRSRAYFTRLEEYKIYSKEWESIIKKVNLKESGLSDLFKEAKDEKGLVEKWFLDAIENKLNQQQDRMKNFESLLQKYMIQYQANEGNFKKKEGILRFQKELEIICELENQLLTSEQTVMSYEQDLAVLYATLEQLIQETEDEQVNVVEQLRGFKQDLHRLNYEEQSLAIYELQNKQDIIKQEQQGEAQKLQQLNEQQTATLKQQRIYEAANRYQTYKQASIDVQRCESELKVAKQSQEELSPRLNDLGYSLSVAFEQQLELEEVALEEDRQKVKDMQQRQQQLKALVEVKQEDRQLLASDIGALTQATKAFDEAEEALMKKYPLELRRNLEGEYMTGTLEMISDQVKLTCEDLKKHKKEKLEIEQKLKISQHQALRDYEDAKEELGGLKATIPTQQAEVKDLEDELVLRKQLSLYIAWPEEDLFKTEEMIQAFSTKRQGVLTKIREHERELDELTKVYTKLKSGEVFELPEAFKAALNDEGISYVLGIDWLKRNQQSFEANQALIAKNPFLPYSLILSKAQMQQFKGVRLQLNTPFPIPLLVREEIEDILLSTEVAGHCYVKPLHFYVSFNEELLDDVRLQQLLLLKEKEMTDLRHKLDTQATYLTRYEEHISILKYQKLSQKTYDAALKRLADSLAEQERLQKRLLQLQSDKETYAKQLNTVIQEVTDLSMQLQSAEQKQSDIIQFKLRYDRYLAQVKELKSVREQLEGLTLEMKTLNEELSDCLNSYESLRQSEHEKQFHLRDTKTQFQRFEHYVDGMILEKDVEDLIAEFEAITEQLKGVLRRSEEDLVAAKQRFTYEEEELHRLMKRYDLVDADYQQVLYDPYAHDQVMTMHDQLASDILVQSKVLQQLDISLATLKTEEKNAYALLKRDLNESEVLPKSEVVKREFSLLKTQIQAQINQAQQTLDRLEKQLSLYQREASNLVEYRQELEKAPTIEENLRVLNEKAWHDKRAVLLRDYKAQKEVGNALKHEITDEFNRIGSLDLFEMDFFNLPFKNFLAVKHTPRIFIEQYETMMQAFNHTLGKISVDIAQSEEEKKTVVQLLLDYVQEIHKHLGLIDQNSSIQIRGKNIKMLRIKLPNWDEFVNLYGVRMNDFVTTLTQSCLELMKQNENIQEFIGHQVTTKRLYDQIVGTSNVEIKLYKIEEQREYLITWEQVAKNSGGEGFLSAFVILTSLLSFMRRDETDIFSNFEEGKVLLMDNPFAQTNAAHLLKPLIELAKKNNTQLICLSGLGGDSIYSRFENIYSLSLVPSSFKKGCEYLKTQHIKGEVEPHLVIPSRVYVEDAIQETLLF